MAARGGDYVPSQEEIDRLRDEWYNLIDEVEGLKQRLESTEGDEERKQLKKDINLKEIKRDLARAKYDKADNLYNQRSYEEKRADGLRSGWDVFDDVEIRLRKKKVEWEEAIKQHQQRLLKMEQEEELERQRQLLKKRLKQGSVKMRNLVCITIGLPGVGKTCLTYLLMGEPPPELRSSTILSESPIRIEVTVQKISEMKIRAIGEEWVKVTSTDIMDIVGGLIILASKQHPDSMKFLEEEAAIIEEPVIIEQVVEARERAAPRESLLQKFVKWVRNRKPAQSDPPEPLPSKPVAISKQASARSCEACRKAVDTIMGRLVKVIERLKASSESSEHAVQLSSSDHHSVPRCDWVLFSDCGGQPKYHELLPLFVQYISAALCVIRLTDNLDKVQPVEYYSDDKPLCLPAQSQLSVKDTIKCLVNTVQSFSTQKQKPKVIFVGTHLDELEEKERDLQKQSSATPESPALAPPHEHLETLQEKNSTLVHTLGSDFSDHLLYYSEDLKQLLYPVNTMKRGERELKMAKLVRATIEKCPAQEIEVPVWWLIYEMLLQEVARLLERKVLSKAECLKLARTMGFGATELEAVLVYFDNTNVIRYSPKVLPDVVFAESQVPLEKVSEYIKKSYILHGGGAASECSPTDGKLIHFRDHGVISRELMSEFRLHYVEGIFSEEDLAALLVERLIFAPIPTPSWALPPPKDEQSQNDQQPSSVSQKPTHSDNTASPKEEEPKESYFFMASSLMTLTEAELKQHRCSSTSVATLLVKFPRGQRRAGVFCCFASYVICQCGWDVILDANVPLYRNCIRFHPKRISPPVTVTVIDSDSFIEVHASISKGATDKECADLLPIIKGAVFAGITAACGKLNYQRTHPELGFLCPHHKDSPHSASITPNRLYWCCDVDTTVSDRLEKRHQLWFGMIADPQLLADAYASLPPSSLMPPQASRARNSPTANTPSTHAGVVTLEGSAQQHIPAAAVPNLSTLPATTGQSLHQSSRTTVGSHPAQLPTHYSLSSTGSGAHLHGDSRVQLPISALNPLHGADQYSRQSHLQSTTTAFSHAQSTTSSSAAHLPEIPEYRYVASQPATFEPTQPHLPAAVSAATSTLPGPNPPLSAEQYSHQSHLQSITTAFPHAQSTTSSAAHLPEIPEYRYVGSQPAISEPTQQHLPAAGALTVPNPNLSSSNVQPSCPSSISVPTSKDLSAQLLGSSQSAPERLQINVSSTCTGTTATPPTPPYSERKPALHELDLLKSSTKTVRIINRVAHKWVQVATRLYFETHDIEGIKIDCHHQTNDASRAMIMKWLSGGGGVRKPITWATLIDALDEAELSEVAKDVVSILQESDT